MSSQTESEHLIELEHAWAEAMRTHDNAQLQALTTDDFTAMIAVQGLPLQSTPKERWLKSMPGYEMQQVSLDTIQAQVFGDVGVVALIWTQTASVNGKDRSGTFFITDIWLKSKAGWRVRERHSSRPEPATAARPG